MENHWCIFLLSLIILMLKICRKQKQDAVPDMYIFYTFSFHTLSNSDAVQLTCQCMKIQEGNHTAT